MTASGEAGAVRFATEPGPYNLGHDPWRPCSATLDGQEFAVNVSDAR